MYEVSFRDGAVITMEASYRAEARYYALRMQGFSPRAIGEVLSARLVKEPA